MSGTPPTASCSHITVASVLALALVMVLLGTVVSRGAAEPVPPGSPVPSDPVFTAHLIDGTTLTGRIHQFGPNGEIALVPAEGKEQVVPLGRLLKLTREGVAFSLTPSDGSLVLFPDGDRLYRTVIGPATETTLEVQSYALGNVALPLESLLGLVLALPSESAAVDALLERVRTEPRPSEVLWLANGDRLLGGFLGLDEKRIKYQAPTGAIELDRGGIVALGFDPALVAYPRPEGDYLELTMADGSRLGVSRARIEQGHVVATTRFKSTIRLALSELVQVHARTASIAYLSERKATAEQYVAYIGPTRPYRRDLNVAGHPLRLAGQSYDRGLGTQSRTLLAYRLAPGDARFQALVGVDDSAGPLGSVVFRVLVDGKERFVSPPMSVRDTPKPIDVDLTGAKNLILVTEFGERGEIRDLADWVEARIIR
jgi:hypothetical protein